ncbi:MAG: tryptophan--tRNA ligase [Christensenellales bacterium]
MDLGKKTIFSGIQPSGVLTLGNYIGALRHWAALQETGQYQCYYCVVDLHAATVRQEASAMRKRCVETLALLLACGLNPEKNVMFMQSHVPAHTELAWTLNCYTYLGELNRMTQFKEKSALHSDNVNAGLFTYPVLMAADILLYQTNLVPVGADQKQHLELARDIALRLNNIYGNLFTVPEAYIPEVGARVMSLQNPQKKMSKSDENENSYISLLDSPEVVLRKCKRAVTDSGSCISFEEGSEGVVNLLSIYAASTGKSKEQAEADFAGKGYGDLKVNTAEAVISVLEPIQKEYGRLLKDKDYLNKVTAGGAQAAQKAAERTLAKVYRKIGYAPREI